jgi:hypothetical protein
MAGRIQQFLSHVLPGVIRPIRILWNEMIGFMFVCLGIIPLFSAVKAYREFDAGREGPGRLLVILFFSGIMLYFGLSSFMRARRISRN